MMSYNSADQEEGRERGVSMSLTTPKQGDRDPDVEPPVDRLPGSDHPPPPFLLRADMERERDVQ